MPQSSAPSDAPRFKVGDRVRHTLTLDAEITAIDGLEPHSFVTLRDDDGWESKALVKHLTPLSASTDSPRGDEPKALDSIELAKMLRDMALRVEEGDSLDGSIEYLATSQAHLFDVIAAYRIGNSEGQGGMRLVGRRASAAPWSGLSTDEAEKLIGAFERAVADAADTVPHDEYTRKLHAAVPVARAALLRALTGETTETR